MVRRLLITGLLATGAFGLGGLAVSLHAHAETTDMANNQPVSSITQTQPAATVEYVQPASNQLSGIASSAAWTQPAAGSSLNQATGLQLQ